MAINVVVRRLTNEIGEWCLGMWGIWMFESVVSSPGFILSCRENLIRPQLQARGMNSPECVTQPSTSWSCMCSSMSTGTLGGS